MKTLYMGMTERIYLAEYRNQLGFFFEYNNERSGYMISRTFFDMLSDY
jgi:hypothetical protein